jgi:dephospho-CoA kinase
MVVLVSHPGSGKSTTANLYMDAGYVSCNQDILKTQTRVAKCIIENLQIQVLKSGRST